MEIQNLARVFNKEMVCKICFSKSWQFVNQQNIYGLQYKNVCNNFN